MSSCSFSRDATASPGRQSPGSVDKGKPILERKRQRSLPDISVLPEGPQVGWWFTKFITTIETGSFQHAVSYGF